MASLRTCLMCGRTEHAVIFREFGVDVLRCRGCGHVFSGYEAEAHYEGYWGDEVEDPGEFYWDEAHGPMYKYEDFFDLLIEGTPPGRLLDVGCGLGYFVRKMQARYPAWETHGYEISPAAVRYATETLEIAHMHQGKVEESSFPDAHFERITLWDVLEHLREPDPLLRWTHDALVPGGALFLHTPNARIQVPKARIKRLLFGIREGKHYLEARDHLHLFTPGSVRQLLERNGFTDVRLVHLRPIQSVAGSKNPVLRLAKNAWFHAVRWLDRLSLGLVNLDNLFVVARRAPGRLR